MYMLVGYMLSGTCDIFIYNMTYLVGQRTAVQVTRTLQRSLGALLEEGCSYVLHLPPSPVATEHDPTDKR